MSWRTKRGQKQRKERLDIRKKKYFLPVIIPKMKRREEWARYNRKVQTRLFYPYTSFEYWRKTTGCISTRESDEDVWIFLLDCKFKHATYVNQGQLLWCHCTNNNTIRRENSIVDVWIKLLWKEFVDDDSILVEWSRRESVRFHFLFQHGNLHLMHASIAEYSRLD